MANLRFQFSSAQLKTIQEVQFGLFSPEEVKNMSVAHILYPETMDDAKQKPRENGLGDPRMGSIDRSFHCATCGEDMQECLGHFGHIELAVPVFHVGFIRKIQKLLETVCHNCGKILIDESVPAFVDALRFRDPKRRFEAIHKLCKTKKECEVDDVGDADGRDPNEPVKKPVHNHGGCGNKHPEIRKDGLRLSAIHKAKKGEDEDDKAHEKYYITPQDALDIFRRIGDDQLRILGLNTQYARPEWMIISVLPVPPPPVRPGVSVDGTGVGMRGEDDLTHKLGDIIRANGNVRRCEQEGSPQHVVSEFEALLQYHVATYMDNNIAGQPQALQKSGRPLKTIRSRLKGKEGRLRGNLMGKRVDFSARTVITGDPHISLDEVGVPRSTAMILTYPETVTPFNIKKLHEMVRNGPNVHPGAKYVIRDENERVDLRHHKRGGEITLQYGWKVERHIIDGDYIIFNRQPSLHKESMMGHRVRVMPFSTFRLNLSVTSPYNADFDGDEMNLHVPQSEETRAEIKELCMVPLQIVSPQRNGPLMGIVQDSLCGIYQLCRRDTFVTKDEVMATLMHVPDWDGVIPPPAIIKPRPLWTGKQLISISFPSGLNLLAGSDFNTLDEKDDLLIQNGRLMYGLLKKKNVGASSGGVVHTIYNELGWEVTVRFFNACQRIVNFWLLHHGFTIGIGDTIPDKKTLLKIQQVVTKQKEEVNGIVTLATGNKLEAQPGMNIRETFESKVTQALNEARNHAGTETSKGLKDFNNALQMSSSGSKGSDINIAQISAIVGQQNVTGKRIGYGFQYRTLPHFTKDDYSPEARGFVENSYLTGLTPSEFYFHAMAGREGLIDTAVKTAETGYIQRRLVKAMEDVMVKYDGTVRNSLGDIIQFVYGEDGLDGKFIENQRVDSTKCSEKEFEKLFRVDLMDPDWTLGPDLLEQAGEIAGDIGVQQYLDEEWEQLQKDRALTRDALFSRYKDESDSFQLPLNIIRTIDSAKTKFRIKSGGSSDLHPAEVIPKVRAMLDRLIVIRGDDPLTLEAQESATLLFKAQLRSRLAFKRLVVEHSLNKLALDNILGDIENRFLRAQADPGEMVGVLAAQSIGEPATQMTLNTFHFTGISSKNVTLGVPRLKEILNVATNLKTPSMEIFQLPDNKLSQDGAKALRSSVEHTTLRSVAEMTEIYYDPIIETTVIEADLDMVESYYILPDHVPGRQAKWMLRIQLGRRKLLDKGLTVSDVAAKIKENYTNDVALIFSDNNADDLVIRLRMVYDEKSGDTEDGEEEEDSTLKNLESFILDTLTVSGVPGVERAFIDSKAFPRIKEDGTIFMSKEDDLCKEWFLNTTGSSLRKVLEVEGIDPYRAYSNSFVEVLDVFGIEAARSALNRELLLVLSFDGSYVNHRHLSLLTDIMTCRGYLMAITRHGINRADTGALMRCSFEETVEILLEAAAAGEIDDCRGISENVMLGQLAPLGTGELEVFLDMDMLATVTSDNSRLMPIMADANSAEGGAATPYDIGSPMYDGGAGGPDYGASFSPMVQAGGAETGGFTSYGDFASGGTSPYGGGASPYAPTSPYQQGGFGSASPMYQSTSPFNSGASPSSPNHYSPSSPVFSPTSPGGALRGYGTSPSASPAYTPQSPAYQSPTAGQTSPSYSPTSPSFSPTSPTSPNNLYGPTSPVYSPSSPNFSPTSPANNQAGVSRFSPKSPYSPSSPVFSPSSPMYQPGARRESPTSPSYSPSSPKFSPSSPAYSPGSGTSPDSSTSPRYSPTSPKYSPTSPQTRR